MAGVGDEGAFALQRVPEPAEQIVHRSGEGGELVFRPRDLKDGVLAAPRHGRGLPPQALHGEERGACQPVRSQAGDGDKGRTADGEPPGYLALRSVISFQRDSGDGGPAGMAGHRSGRDAGVLLVDRPGHPYLGSPGLR